MNETKATMFVFAGNNGSGKSTIRNLIVDRLGVSVNIDPDALACKINNGHLEKSKVSAGKEAIRIARECIRNKWDFTVETTLAGGNVIRQMRDAKEQGFEIIMFYVGLGDVRLNIERVAMRVKNGGHHIETEDIIRRNVTSMNNLVSHLDLIDQLIVVDNSKADGEFILEADTSGIKYYLNELPEWVKIIDKQLQIKYKT
ncbi:zeta toxin family protein [Paenibacillus sp. 19GGS1-52]|uniref:zeta toxin family protein n=1 Tax=Paenibacillus sp. 19GGS1-52 TaxID=2758563 RepID=UPI001EFB8E72|nr:zeta toxin family protein [Paenibacillus sp. 19GGS1-52]ULO06227.1 zeta toxin family protein [Paenibacillus sp. 19GGS1-52]ULO06234.1 zeta toxin family protein [Paenibacillus sp. 19GGS1-52]